MSVLTTAMVCVLCTQGWVAHGGRDTRQCCVRSGHCTVAVACLHSACFAGISPCSQHSVASWLPRGSHVEHTHEVGHAIMEAFPEKIF